MQTDQMQGMQPDLQHLPMILRSWRGLGCIRIL